VAMGGHPRMATPLVPVSVQDHFGLNDDDAEANGTLHCSVQSTVHHPRTDAKVPIHTWTSNSVDHNGARGSYFVPPWIWTL